MLIAELPSFLTLHLKFTIQSAGLLCMIPYAGQYILSIGSGKLFDYMQDYHGMTTRTVRQISQFIAFAVASSVLVLCGFVEDSIGSLICICIAGVSIYII